MNAALVALVLTRTAPRWPRPPEAEAEV